MFPKTDKFVQYVYRHMNTRKVSLASWQPCYHLFGMAAKHKALLTYGLNSTVTTPSKIALSRVLQHCKRDFVLYRAQQEYW